jgi:hypothetical protein
MTWTVTKEEHERTPLLPVHFKLHVRAIIDLEKQDELKELIESLQKHVIE